MPSVWIRDSKGALVPLHASEYPTELELQGFIADHPEVLATALGDDDAAPWLLVKRELSITMDDGDDRTHWSLDHLFIDTEAVPTLVEVKRSSDPRSRREVVAQMLDYAASFRHDWTALSLRSVWEGAIRSAGGDPASELESFLAGTAFDDADTFWAEVQTRITGNRLRLLFVADRLSSHLVRIIEYLNEQLQTTEVLGIEVVPHVDGTREAVAYVPSLRGRTSAVPRTKNTSERRTRQEFDDVLRANLGDDAVALVNCVVDGATALGAHVSIGTDSRNPRLFLNFHSPITGRLYWPLWFNSRTGKVSIPLRWLAKHGAFADDEVRAEVVARFSDAIDRPIDAPRLDGFPGFPVTALAGPEVVDQVIEVLRWIAEAAATPNSET